MMRETLRELNIHHVKTSFYNPKGNAKIERFHRTLHDILSKLMEDNLNTWDLYLNQALAAIRFNVNESSKQSPFFALYNRDCVLPLDNLLKPRRKYEGEEFHKIILQNQHKAFLQTYKILKHSKRKQKDYADKNTKLVDFQIGDPVYHKNHLKMIFYILRIAKLQISHIDTPALLICMISFCKFQLIQIKKLQK